MAAATLGKIKLVNVEAKHLDPVINKLQEAGCLITIEKIVYN